MNLPTNAPRRVLATVAFVCLLPVALAADDWPGWRGPQHDGISRETAWTFDWNSAGPKRLWETNIGIGFSSVSVSRGKLYTAGHRDGQDTVFCFDSETGRELWKHTYTAPLVDNLHEGGPAATPTVDGNVVYTLSKDGQLYCLDAHTGVVAWKQNVGSLADVGMPEWGFSGSPLIVDELLIVDAGGTLGLNKHTGDMLWKTKKYAPGYGSAVPCQFFGAPCVAVLNNYALILVRCRDGAELAQHPWETNFLTNSTTPIVSGGTIFISTGYQRGCALLEPEEMGFRVVYENGNMSNHMNNCVLLNGSLFGFDGNSHNRRLVKLVCLDYATGQVKWSHRGLGCGSVMAADGKLIVLSDDGDLVIVEATAEEYRELARAHVVDGRCWTVPVLANGRIYCRNAEGDLVCLDVRHSP